MIPNGVNREMLGAVAEMANAGSVANLLRKEDPETGLSPADLMADLINVQRADTKRLAEAHGIEIEVKMLFPDRAAELMAGAVEGNGIELVVLFNELEDQRNQILQEVLSDDEYEQYVEQKQGILFTGSPEETEDEE